MLKSTSGLVIPGDVGVGARVEGSGVGLVSEVRVGVGTGLMANTARHAFFAWGSAPFSSRN